MKTNTTNDHSQKNYHTQLILERKKPESYFQVSNYETNNNLRTKNPHKTKEIASTRASDDTQ